jgi:hypothetical protein
VAAIFISYRRGDSGGHAGRLYDRLSRCFAADALFYDHSTIEWGDTFPESIAKGLADAKVVLVLIGPQWLDELNKRAGKPDFVRHEIETALSSRRQGRGPDTPGPSWWGFHALGLGPRRVPSRRHIATLRNRRDLDERGETGRVG